MRGGGLMLVAALLLAPGCSCGMPDGDYFGTVPTDYDPTHLRFCNSGEPQYLDPAMSTSTTDIKPVYAMWDGLTRHNLAGLPEPSIATHWDVSEDQRTFTFHLRDDARWSTGRALTASDFRYHIVRILHPLTASSNTDPHWKLKNGEDFTANKVRLMLRDSGPFKAGDVVVMVESADKKDKDKNEAAKKLLSYTNRFTAAVDLELRDLPGSPATLGPAPYFTVDAGEEVTIIEKAPGADGKPWAYVHRDDGDGVYGWVPAELLTGQENADRIVRMHAVPRTRVPGVQISREEFDAIVKAAEEPDKAPRPAEADVRVADMMMLPEVIGMQTPDEHTLVLETENPTPYIIDLSPQRAYRPSPREAVSRWPQKWSRPEHIITSGPYHLRDWKMRDYIALEKSPTYWDAANVKLDRVTIYSMNDQSANANYYFYGGCDAVTSNNIPSSYLPILNGEKRDGRAFTDFYTAPFLGIYIYLLNTEKLPNVHLRRALGYALDRRPIPEFIHGGERPAAQLMPGVGIEKLSPADQVVCGVKPAAAPKDGRPDCSAWFEEVDSGDVFCADQRVASMMIPGQLCYLPPAGLDYDPDKAKAELALARQEMGGKFPSTVTIKFNSGSEGHKLIAEYVQNEWKRVLKLDVQLEVQEWKTFLADTKAGEYQVARFGWILNFPDVEAEMLPQFQCGAPDNRTKWCNPEFEKLYKRAQATFDRKERLKLLRQAERVLIEDQPVLPFYVYTLKHLQKPYVRDLAKNFTDQVPFEKAWLDPNWTP
jgi:oligopeptide transport system substrate-binding protein